jgi:hypothetical protein
MTVKSLQIQATPALAGFRLPLSLSPRRPNSIISNFTAAPLTTTGARAVPSQQSSPSKESSTDKSVDTSLEGTYEALSSDRQSRSNAKAADSADEVRSAEGASQERHNVISSASGEGKEGDQAAGGNREGSEAAAAVKKVQEVQLQEENDNVVPANPS